MKATFFSVFLTALLLSAAARPGKGDTVLKNKIKQTVRLTDGLISEYSYTPAGRILRIRNSKGVITTYTYPSGMIIEAIYDSVHNASGTDTFRLNGKGLADDMHNMTEASEGMTLRCRYNAAGYMVRSTTLQNGSMVMANERKYTDGDEVSLMQSDANSKIPNMLYFSYYQDRSNTIGNENMGMDFMGRSSKRLLRGTLGITSQGDTLRSSYSYHFDTHGRVGVKVTYTRSVLSDSVEYSYY